MVEMFAQLVSIFKEGGAWVIFAVLSALLNFAQYRRNERLQARADKAADMVQEEKNKLWEQVMLPKISAVPDKEEAK
ncbi:hypothetical protein [Paenibacillus kandeliae]|uniref:hypothetical protein n=1 Tax=Paenibacillus kandeliae TaxID=3231269 RepID=UPI003459B6A7